MKTLGTICVLVGYLLFFLFFHVDGCHTTLLPRKPILPSVNDFPSSAPNAILFILFPVKTRYRILRSFEFWARMEYKRFPSPDRQSISGQTVHNVFYYYYNYYCLLILYALVTNITEGKIIGKRGTGRPSDSHPRNRKKMLSLPNREEMKITNKTSVEERSRSI
jgi:hypothetical protein